MSYAVIWPEGGEDRFRGILTRLYPSPPGIAGGILRKFHADMQLLPMEWPTLERPATDHVWRAGAAALRYRVFPARQQVEVLAIDEAPAISPAPGGKT